MEYTSSYSFYQGLFFWITNGGAVIVGISWVCQGKFSGVGAGRAALCVTGVLRLLEAREPRQNATSEKSMR
jgi:hypothetical protein